jgi:hypothetical protein
LLNAFRERRILDRPVLRISDGFSIDIRNMLYSLLPCRDYGEHLILRIALGFGYEMKLE